MDYTINLDLKKKCHPVTSKKKRNMETTMEKVGLCSSTHQPFRAVVSMAARVEANR